MIDKHQLLTLVDAYGRHTNTADATISNKMVGSARLVTRLRGGLGCTLESADRAWRWLSTHWPVDLEWPRSVPRPPKSKEAA